MNEYISWLVTMIFFIACGLGAIFVIGRQSGAAPDITIRQIVEEPTNNYLEKMRHY